MNIALSKAAHAGPSGTHQDAFFDYVTLVGYSPRHCSLLNELFANLDRWLASKQLGVADVCDAVLREFVADRVAAGRTTSISMRAMKPVISYLSECGVEVCQREHPPEGPLQTILEEYRKYLVDERGVQRKTAERYISEIKPFLEDKAAGVDDVRDWLSELTEADVIAIVAATCPKMSTSGAAMFVTALRAFLAFLHLSGIIDRSMTASVPTVPGRRMSNLPKGIEADTLKLLLDRCRSWRDITVSPEPTSSICAAHARSTKIAAVPLSAALRSGGGGRYSFTAQRGFSGQLTGRGLCRHLFSSIYRATPSSRRSQIAI